MTVNSALFKGAMVRALLREIDHPGTGKTMTRRIITARNFKLRGHDFHFHRPDSASLASAFKGARDFRWIEGAFSWIADPDEMHPLGIFVDCRGVPKYVPDDRLWVREHWRTEVGCYDYLAPSEMGGEETILYAADADWSLNKTVGRHRQGMHMPRWASRLTLIVSDVRIERLQDITEADAIAEGVERDSDGWRDYLMPQTQCCSTAKDSFRTLWDSINGAGAWKANPWVTVTTFQPFLINIDLMVAA